MVELPPLAPEAGADERPENREALDAAMKGEQDVLLSRTNQPVG